MEALDFDEDLDELSSAEDFLGYFEIEYEPSVVHVNRLHILQRFNDYLEQASADMPQTDTLKYGVYKRLLTRAYEDFVHSNAQTEKVLKVYKMAEPQEVFVSLGEIQK